MDDKRLWEFMYGDDEIIIRKEYEINYRYSATYMKSGLGYKKGKGMTAFDALADLLKMLGD